MRHTLLVVEINRFRLPDFSPSDVNIDIGQLESAEFGLQLARFDGTPPRGKSIPLSPRTILLFDYYHHGALIRGEHSQGQLRAVKVEGERTMSAQFHTRTFTDLAAVWAMATIYHELGKEAFAKCPGMKKHLGEFYPTSIELAGFGITPVWGFFFNRGEIELIIPRIRADDTFSRDESLAEAHYALLAITESLYNDAVKEQLGEPSDRAGEAAKRIMSAPKILHR